MKYVTGSASAAEIAQIECKAAESDEFMQKVRSYILLRDNFDTIWKTISAKRIGELWQQINGYPQPVMVTKHGDDEGTATDEGDTPLPEILAAAAIAAEYTIPSRPVAPAASGQDMPEISLRISRDNRGQVTAYGPEEYLIDIASTKNSHLGIAAGPGDYHGLGIESEQPDANKISASWRVPLGPKMGQIEMNAASKGQDQWEISFDMGKCIDSESLRELRVRVSADSGEEKLQCTLNTVKGIPLQNGKWCVEIFNKNIKRVIKIDLCELM